MCRVPPWRSFDDLLVSTLRHSSRRERCWFEPETLRDKQLKSGF
jgi:hypothetical protein